MNVIRSIFDKINIGISVSSLHLSSTTLFAGLAVVFLLLYGLSLGRTKALISLLGIYIALAFDATFPYLSQVHNALGFIKEIYLTRIILFLLVYLAVFAVLNRSFAKSRLTLGESSIISVAAISLLQIGLLIAVLTNIIPADMLKRLPNYFADYFGNRTALFYWLIVPVLALVFIKKDKKRSYQRSEV